MAWWNKKVKKVDHQTDAYWQSIKLGFGEYKALLERRAAFKGHICTFDFKRGHGTFMWVCRECGNGTGVIEELQNFRAR